jgi:putative ABC transport system permease protein
LRKVSAVEAIKGTNITGKTAGAAFPINKMRFRSVNISLGIRDAAIRFRSYITPVMVFLLCTFLMILPINFLSTLNSPDFVGYTGVGYCDAIITLRYSADMEERYATVMETLAADKDVSVYADRVTANYKVRNLDGNFENISIQNGDFTTFPVAHSQGGAPTADNEIALSLLNSREYAKSVGDAIEIMVDGEPVSLTVCGIYQDLTNGGKSAQANLPYEQENVLWYSASLNFAEGVDAASKISAYSEAFAPAKVLGIDKYSSQTIASTIQQFETVTLAISVVAIIVAILVTALFLKLMFAKDRRQIIIMKGLGFTSAHIRAQYIAAAVICLIAGLVIGTVAANTLGEGLVGLLMSGMGASHIDFVINPLMSLLVFPGMLLIAVLTTTIISATYIQKCGNYIVSE